MSRPNGIHLDDIPIPGFGQRKVAGGEEVDDTIVPTLEQLAGGSRQAGHCARLRRCRQATQAGDKHESDYFTAAVKAIDNSIAIMRLVEGRIALFEQLAQHIRDLREEILGLADQAAAYLRSVDVEVEEARHDMAMAQQLRAEEQARDRRHQRATVQRARHPCPGDRLAAGARNRPSHASRRRSRSPRGSPRIR